uniref:Protein MMS22-like n=1 Tax=Culex pipiens TaxID=7175 RepID=A0A8D8HXT7_CULPI
MFDCNNRPAELSSFVGPDVRKLIEVDRYRAIYAESSASPEDENRPAVLFGLEFYYLDDKMLQRLALEARTTMCHLGNSDVWQELGNTQGWWMGVQVGRFLRVLIGSCGEDALYKEEELLEVISVVTNSLPAIGLLADGFSGISVKRIDSGSYGSFHVALEWRWYALMLMYEVHKRISGKVDFEAAYRDLLEGLVGLASIKYNDRTIQNELTEEMQFYCPCVKNIWIGMLVLATSSGVDFWANLQIALEKILNEVHAKSWKRTKANSLLFQAWLVHGIASLYQYRLLDETTFKETPIITLPPDYTILDRALKEVTLGALPEDNLRTFLLLLKPIYTKWWPIKYDLVITLWEYFSKRLNSPFQLPQEPPINLACVSRSPKGIIDQAAQHSTQQAFDSLSTHTSSFKSYITLMAFMLRHLSTSSQKNQSPNPLQPNDPPVRSAQTDLPHRASHLQLHPPNLGHGPSHSLPGRLPATLQANAPLQPGPADAELGRRSRHPTHHRAHAGQHGPHDSVHRARLRQDEPSSAGAGRAGTGVPEVW